MLISLELNPADCASRSFANSVNHARRSAFHIDWIHSKLNADIIVAASLIDLDDFLARFFQLLFVNRLVQFQFDFFAQSLRFYPLGSVDYDLSQDRTCLHSYDHLLSIALRLGKNANVLNRPSLVEGRNIVLDYFVRIWLGPPWLHFWKKLFRALCCGPPG